MSKKEPENENGNDARKIRKKSKIDLRLDAQADMGEAGGQKI